MLVTRSDIERQEKNNKKKKRIERERRLRVVCFYEKGSMCLSRGEHGCVCELECACA